MSRDSFGFATKFVQLCPDDLGIALTLPTEHLPATFDEKARCYEPRTRHLFDTPT